MKEKVFKSLERGLLIFIMSALILLSLKINFPQVLFWSFYLGLSTFIVRYNMGISEEKAIRFCILSSYLSVIGIVLGIVAAQLNLQLATSIMIASVLSFLGSRIIHSVLTATEIQDEHHNL